MLQVHHINIADRKSRRPRETTLTKLNSEAEPATAGGCKRLKILIIIHTCVQTLLYCTVVASTKQKNQKAVRENTSTAPASFYYNYYY